MDSLEQASDAELLERSGRGDETAFVVLYRRRRSMVYRYALRLSGDPAVAEEAVQEAFVALVERPDGFDSKRGDLPAYLIGTARNRVLRKLGRERLVTGVELDDVSADAPLWTNADENPLEALEQAERSLALSQAVDSLPLPYREAVTLCDIEGFSYAQAAQAASVAVGTIRSRLHRARGLLFEKLSRRLEATAPTRRSER